MHLSKRNLTILWAFTGLTTLILLAVTILLSARADQIRESGFSGYIMSDEPSVYLRAEPDTGSSITTLVEAATLVRVLESESIRGFDWYLVDTGVAQGWIAADQVSPDPPPGNS